MAASFYVERPYITHHPLQAKTIKGLPSYNALGVSLRPVRQSKQSSKSFQHVVPKHAIDVV